MSGDIKVVYRMVRVEEKNIVLDLINNESLKNDTVLKRTKIDVSRCIVADVAGVIAGCICYKTWSSGLLPEVCSWVVDQKYRGSGIGSELIFRMTELLKAKGFRVTFCLTSESALFVKAGFIEVDVGLFPAKIWRDCHKCKKNFGSPLNPSCCEVALYKKLV